MTRHFVVLCMFISGCIQRIVLRRLVQKLRYYNLLGLWLEYRAVTGLLQRRTGHWF